MVCWHSPSYFLHPIILDMPHTGRATATVRLSLQSETKTTEHTHQLVGRQPRFQPDDAQIALPDQIISQGTLLNKRVTDSNAN